MRKLIVAEFVTLDGVIQAPGGADEDTEGGFTHGGWTWPYWHDSIGEHFSEAMSQADAFLLGRKTWEIHGQAFDPMPAGDPFGDAMKAARKYVVSRTLTSTDLWRNSTQIQGDVVAAVRALKQEPGKNILSDGSSQLLPTLFAHGLVDELVLHVYPLSLGSGKRLFPPDTRLEWKLLHAEALPTGVVYQRFARP